MIFQGGYTARSSGANDDPVKNTFPSTDYNPTRLNNPNARFINLRVMRDCRRLFGRRGLDGQTNVQENEHNEREHVPARHRQPDVGKRSGPSQNQQRIESVANSGQSSRCRRTPRQLRSFDVHRNNDERDKSE